MLWLRLRSHRRANTPAHTSPTSTAAPRTHCPARPGAAPVHAQPAAFGFDHPHELMRRELRRLIGIDDLGAAIAVEGFFQHPHGVASPRVMATLISWPRCFWLVPGFLCSASIPMRAIRVPTCLRPTLKPSRLSWSRSMRAPMNGCSRCNSFIRRIRTRSPGLAGLGR